MENEVKVAQEKQNTVEIPEGQLCGHNCANNCRYWEPNKRDSNGRQYCNWYGSYYYPSERQGCLSYES